MVNYNGVFVAEDKATISVTNRGLNYGDSLFETIRVVHNKILFWEDHYFRLMASMRILRMEIPMNFTMEFLEEQILDTIAKSHLSNSSVRVKLLVYRESDGLYLPKDNSIGYIIMTNEIASDFYTYADDSYRIDLYKDHYVLSGLLSNLKTNNRIINVTASVYAKENEFNNCLLLNEKKEVVEAINGNIFLVTGNTIKTPSLESGCIKGIFRKQLIEILKTSDELELVETAISPFELQKADELFITNVITGIRSVSDYRKKHYNTSVAKKMLAKINAKIRLG